MNIIRYYKLFCAGTLDTKGVTKSLHSYLHEENHNGYDDSEHV